MSAFARYLVVASQQDSSAANYGVPADPHTGRAAVVALDQHSKKAPLVKRGLRGGIEG
jgi:hypothetical protein